MNARDMMAYVDGELDEAQRSALVAETERNPALLPVFAELYRQRFLLACALREEARLRVKRSSAQTSLRWRPLIWAAAASMIAALGIRFLHLRKDVALPIGQALATVTETVGQTQAFGLDGTRAVLAVGDVLLADQRIETGPGARVRLVFQADTAETMLSESSVLTIASDRLLRLEQGALVASVPVRLAGQPFAVTTPNARAEVLGTRFGLRVGDRTQETEDSVPGAQPSTINHQPSSTPFTRLDVEQGCVRLVRLADNAMTDVAAGQFAVAGEDIELKPYPRGAEWIDGRILFEDDFSDGLRQWDVGQYRIDTDTRELTYEPVSSENEPRVVPTTERRDGQEAPGVRLSRLKNADAFPFIRLKRRIEAESYAAEWEYRADLVASSDVHAEMQAWGCSDVAKVWESNEPTLISRDTRPWLVHRRELAPLRDPASVYRWRLDTFRNGRIVRTHYLNLDPGIIGFHLIEGAAFLNRCVIRERVPAPRSAPHAEFAPEGAILFEDDFGSGTLNKWHSAVGDWQVVPRPDGKGHCLRLAWKANEPITPRILARLDSLSSAMEISYDFLALPTQYGFGLWFRDPVTGWNVQARDIGPRTVSPSPYAPVYANEWARHVTTIRRGRLHLRAYQDGRMIYEKKGELAGPFSAIGLAGFFIRQDSDLYVDNIVVRQIQKAPAPDSRAERSLATTDNDG